MQWSLRFVSNEHNIVFCAKQHINDIRQAIIIHVLLMIVLHYYSQYRTNAYDLPTTIFTIITVILLLCDLYNIIFVVFADLAIVNYDVAIP